MGVGLQNRARKARKTGHPGRVQYFKILALTRIETLSPAPLRVINFLYFKILALTRIETVIHF